MRRQRKKIIWLTALAAASWLMLAGCTKNGMISLFAGAKPAAAQAPVMLRLADTMPENHPSARAAALFAQLVSERSGGRIQIRIYYNSELGNSAELMEQLEFGGVTLARVNALDVTDVSSQMREYFAPGNFSSMDQQMEWVRDSQTEISEVLGEKNIKPLVWYYPDYRCFYSSSQEIPDWTALEGRRIQIVPCRLMSELMRGWGAEAVGSTSLDPYKFFYSGNIDGAESAFGEYICCNYVQYSRFVTVYDDLYFPDVILMNSQIMDTLSKEDQELLQVCAEATYEYQKSQMETLHSQWERELQDNLGAIWEEGDFR